MWESEKVQEVLREIDTVSRLKKAKASLSPCRPPVWARNGHVHTILAHLLPSPGLRKKGDEFLIELNKDTERIHSTYLKGKNSIVVYLFHGVAGSAEDGYMQRIARKLSNAGYHVFLNNHRGSGKGAGLATEPYHSGRSSDISKVIAFGKKKLPDHLHVAIGFSLSANILLLLAAKVGAEVQPDVAITVNAPINLKRAADILQEGANQIYDRVFTRELKKYIEKNRPQDAEKLKGITNLLEFDDLLTAPLGGYRDREDYYAQCSSKPHLKKINIPTVILSAHDDPFVRIEDYLDAEYSENCVIHLEDHGGHLGYLNEKGLGFERWLDQAILHYLGVLIK